MYMSYVHVCHRYIGGELAHMSAIKVNMYVI